jgi:hypothetical protein
MNPDQNNTLDIYNNKLNTYFNRITQTKYLFEITKCCEYSEFLSIYKEYNLAELYKATMHQFAMNQLNELFVLNELREKLIIPNDENIQIKDFINMNNAFFRPIYPLPATVVYRVYFDDGHVHIHEN